MLYETQDGNATMTQIAIENTKLDLCVAAAQSDQVVTTHDPIPEAFVLGIERLDDEQVQSVVSEDFWAMIQERRGQRTMNRAELEQKLDARNQARPQ